jgi:hypothetical protein
MEQLYTYSQKKKLKKITNAIIAITYITTYTGAPYGVRPARPRSYLDFAK